MKSLIAISAITLLLPAVPAVAQDYREQDYFRYCQERAREFSGYDGRAPNRYNRRSGALEGMARGAAGGTIEGLLRGENRRERRERRRRGAIIGGLIGAITDGAERRDEQRRARAYRLELDACMQAGDY